jgi:hypothetical protein
MQISKLFALTLFILLFTTSCLLSYNKKNLDNHLSKSVGGVASYLSQNDAFRQKIILLNGNIAYNFELKLFGIADNGWDNVYRYCDMYFEVNPKNNKIIGYTITDENADRDCRMLLK